MQSLVTDNIHRQRKFRRPKNKNSQISFTVTAIMFFGLNCIVLTF